MQETIRIPVAEMQAAFFNVLLKEGFARQKAETLAEVFTANSVDGVYTHGVNRFSTFVQYVKEGIVKPHAEPALASAFQGLEQWCGNGGPGPLNALAATDRAVALSKQHGIGCVALADTNHWMRGGYYGWHAAKQGCVLLAWTNTTALMPAWGAVDARLGNNPLVVALPHDEEAVVWDAALSQYSYGALGLAAAKGERMPVSAGYDVRGLLTNDPAAVLQSRRPLPVGYWKGAGLALLLDILAAVLSGGLSTHQISGLEKEHRLSQVFVCIHPGRLANASLVSKTVRTILADYHASKMEDGKRAAFPGEGVLERRKQNRENGVPVLQRVWTNILALEGNT